MKIKSTLYEIKILRLKKYKCTKTRRDEGKLTKKKLVTLIQYSYFLILRRLRV